MKLNSALEHAQRSLGRGQQCAFGVKGFEFGAMPPPKRLVSFTAGPEVERHVGALRRHVAEKPRPAVFGIPAKEDCPVAFGAIDCFKALFAVRLDFEFPKDYKHRCPISCSRTSAIPAAIKKDKRASRVYQSGRTNVTQQSASPRAIMRTGCA